MRLVQTSQDVIHDFAIPAFRVRQDALPGGYETLWFTPTKVGEYRLFCAEFCGTDHSVMAGRLVVVTPEEYARWNAAQPEGDDLAHQGKALFHSLGCSGCHTPGSTVHAPDLGGIYGRAVQLTDGRTVTADEAYLRDCILLPDKNRVAGFPSLMPNFTGSVTPGQVISLVAYIKSLSGPSTNTVQGASP